MEDTTKIWLDDADYDIKSAAAMLKAGRYFYVVFMCHLAIEKMLKAAWVENKKETPPKVHGLVFLSASVFAKEEIPDDVISLINDLDDKGVLTRYPDGRKKIASRLTDEYSAAVLKQTKDMHGWLKNRLT